MEAKATHECIYQGCRAAFVPTKKCPGPHCAPCTERYLELYAPLKRGGVRTTRLGNNYNPSYRA